VLDGQGCYGSAGWPGLLCQCRMARAVMPVLDGQGCYASAGWSGLLCQCWMARAVMAVLDGQGCYDRAVMPVLDGQGCYASALPLSIPTLFEQRMPVSASLHIVSPCLLSML